MKKQLLISALTVLLFAGCGGEKQKNQDEAGSQENSGLTEFELKHGIGPINEVIAISEIDQEMAEKGETLFTTKCSACHKVDEQYIGPNLGTVLNDRSPTFVMNMILNPQEMVKKHPVAKELLAEYMSPMPNQNLEVEEARAIVEYLASVQTN